MRISAFLIFLLCLFNKGYAQHEFSVSISINGKMDAKNVSCSYFNGKTEVLVEDSFVNNVLIAKGFFYSPYTVFKIELANANKYRYEKRFFLNQNPAEICLDYNPAVDKDGFRWVTVKNAVPLYDTSNILFKQMSDYRINESSAVSVFWDKHGDNFQSNDSLRKILSLLMSALNITTVEFLKNHANNYFSFWYFKEQVVFSSFSFLSHDTAYLKSLIKVLRKDFPRKYVKTWEGEALIDELERGTKPHTFNTNALHFTGKDVDGNTVRLRDFKNKYVLLDFWASWCFPCLQEMPTIKKLRDEIPENKLVILGVSADRNVSALKKAILKYEIPWTNIYEGARRIENLYGINALPTTILINDKGKIVYNSAKMDDQEELIRLLRNIK